jgi:N-acetyltransferase
MERHIAGVLDAQAAGDMLAFAVVNLRSGRVVGQTGFHDISQRERSMESGMTWLSPEAQGTGINTESKYLLLRHAFEVMGAIRVQFRARTINVRSQRAIERLGATPEGIQRCGYIAADGSYGDRVVYSIIAAEWPSVKEHLESLLQG